MKIDYIGTKKIFQTKGSEMLTKAKKPKKKDTHYYLSQAESKELVKTIGSHAVVIMQWLYNYSPRGGSKISNAKIADGTGLHESIVKRIMPQLKKSGYYDNFSIGNGYSRLLIGKGAVVIESSYMDDVLTICRESKEWKKVLLDTYQKPEIKTVEELCENMLLDGLTNTMLKQIINNWMR